MASFVTKRASNEIMEYKCFACSKKGKLRRSEKFCVQCHKHFCTKCLEAHNVINDDHALQDPSQAAGEELLPTERCPKHPTKLVDTYCKDHDDVGCSTCSLDNHRSCEAVVYIPKEVHKLLNEDELQHTKEELDRVIGMLTEGQRMMDTKAETLQTTKEKQLSAIDCFVEILVAKIRNLGKTEKERLSRIYMEEGNNFQRYSKSCQDVKTDLLKTKSELNRDDENEAQLFITIKRCKKSINVTDQLIENAQEISKNEFPQFRSDIEFEQYLNSINSIGFIDRIVPLNKMQSISIQSLHTLTQTPKLYKVRWRKNIDIRIKEDTHDCCIVGTCLLPGGSLLLSDYHNQKLKCLDTTTYTVIDHCGLSANPRGVCCISQQEAAVCLRNKKIQFVSIGPSKMVVTRSIQLNHECYGISYWDNRLCVSNLGNDVLFYNLSGSLMKRGSFGLSSAQHTSSSNSGDALYIADWNLGLIGVDISGQKIFRYSGLGLDNCSSVCKDGRGSVFVGGWSSRNVVQVTERGHPLGEVVKLPDDVPKPSALSFDCISSRLFVSGNSGKVSVLMLKI